MNLAHNVAENQLIMINSWYIHCTPTQVWLGMHVISFIEQKLAVNT